ncbi:MAG: ImmA/IrrE family metallo-endopeptidase [Actinobacteria bacterium]|nr:ImmA/IrrE family metallo-endopeptidase [Actinomycetota bacterium]
MSKNHIAVLRDLVPQRPLLYEEALRYAELQADRLLELAKITHPAVPESVVTNLPRLEVRRYTPFPTSGASHFSEGKWLIAINGAEPETRQRFSLAHELKHIIDHAGSDLYFSNFPSQERHRLRARLGGDVRGEPECHDRSLKPDRHCWSDQALCDEPRHVALPTSHASTPTKPHPSSANDSLAND